MIFDLKSQNVYSQTRRSTNIDMVKFVASKNDIPQPVAATSAQKGGASMSGGDASKTNSTAGRNGRVKTPKDMMSMNGGDNDNNTLDVISEPVFVADVTDISTEDDAMAMHGLCDTYNMILNRLFGRSRPVGTAHTKTVHQSGHTVLVAVHHSPTGHVSIYSTHIHLVYASTTPITHQIEKRQY
jgi:hypothetical protein